ncbi:unnamed protein product [Arabidopsis lyrata]|uniref:Defensin-like protein n=1 Tax=Arabidopsis lyrata subsp. lyrata TaxID=81972 RepID=D7MH93_ARALL|nr:hypothetical protein ARALYDRAFT_915510 [Arabidopsis lyrata subsp. lyrata]CAH8276779.1 unnamed protein product [Arabidopsis lyrata]
MCLFTNQTGHGMQCYSGVPCKNTATCNNFCRPRNNNLGGVCLIRANSCCCYVSVFESHKSSISKDTNNVVITN